MQGVRCFSKESDSGELLCGLNTLRGMPLGHYIGFKCHLLGWYFVRGQQAEYRGDTGVAWNAVPHPLMAS